MNDKDKENWNPFPEQKDNRVIAWFSCGASSTIATKFALEHYGKDNVIVAYCDTLASEHPDNIRYMNEVEQWLDVPILKLKSPFFRDIYDVFESVRYIKGRYGAPCTTKMKKDVRKAFQREDDIHVFGYTVEESVRKNRLVELNPDLTCAWFLTENNVTHDDCLDLVQHAGIELPAMYKLGYRNNNCIGCVKGAAGYWNRIRVDFPEIFDRMAKLERKFNYALVKVKGQVCFLDELPPDVGRYSPLPDMSCGPQCVLEDSEEIIG